MNRKLAAIALLSILAICVFQVPAQARCPLCSTALENQADGKGMAASFNKGILFLLGIPYVICGTMGVVIYRGYRKKKAAERRPANPYIPR
jgi:hypothetical protein